MVITWLLMWLNVSVATLNITLQLLVIYRYRFVSNNYFHPITREYLDTIKNHLPNKS